MSVFRTQGVVLPEGGSGWGSMRLYRCLVVIKVEAARPGAQRSPVPRGTDYTTVVRWMGVVHSWQHTVNTLCVTRLSEAINDRLTSDLPGETWSRLGESNPRPTHYECVALTD